MAVLAGRWVRRFMGGQKDLYHGGSGCANRGEVGFRERMLESDEPVSLLIFAKTYGAENWEIGFAETVPNFLFRSEDEPRVVGTKTEERVRRAIGRYMDDPRKITFRANLWPCAIMCTIHYHQRPSPERPRLLVFVYCDK